MFPRDRVHVVGLDMGCMNGTVVPARSLLLELPSWYLGVGILVPQAATGPLVLPLGDGFLVTSFGHVASEIDVSSTFSKFKQDFSFGGTYTSLN